MSAQRLKEIFAEAIERPEGADRDGFVDAACWGDATLRAEVDALIREHARLGGFLDSDLGAAPAEVTVSLEPGSARTFREIAEALGGLPEVLFHNTELADDGRRDAHDAPFAPAPDPSAGRYQVFGEIARGGMGAVLEARDHGLGRPMAIKVLLESHRGNPALVRRFVEEAQIGGQLQHPGIVPIYDIGAFPDRRPFFAMKLVRGCTLAELIDKRADPSADLPRFLGIFEQVCQTMAYAHSRGVIHRDLKPSNVMVGRFGEVQVMDWGLAKVLGRGGGPQTGDPWPPTPHEEVVATSREPGSDLSRPGSVMGTPAYMSPEQARGETAALDERGDVFALGSMLCQVLTGRPAFSGGSSSEILKQAAAGATTDALAWLAACGAEGDLVSLACDCLAVEPAGRPQHAGIVARRVADYLASVQERLRAAELARVRERAQRRLTTVVAAAVVLVAGLAGGGYTWYQRSRAAHAARMAARLDDALARASRLQDEARAAVDEPAKWDLALSAAREANRLLADGEPTDATRRRVTETVARFQRDRDEAVARARQAQTERTLVAELEESRENALDIDDFENMDAEFTAAFRRAGLDVDTDPERLGRWIAGRRKSKALLSCIDFWLHYATVGELPKAHTARIARMANQADPDPVLATLRRHKGREFEATVHSLARDEASFRKLPLSRKIWLANFHEELNDRERAVRLLRIAAEDHPDDPWVHFRLGSIQMNGDSVRLRDFAPSASECVAHLTAFVALRPKSWHGRAELGYALYASGKVKEGIAQCQAAVRLAPRVAQAHGHLAYILSQDKQTAIEAIAESREAIRLNPDFFLSYLNMVLPLESLGRVDEAISAAREAARLKPTYYRPHYVLGSLCFNQSKLAEAEAACRAAVRLNPAWYGTHNLLGKTLSRQGKGPEAEAELREAIRLKPGHFDSHLALAGALVLQEKRGAAIAELRECVRIDPKLPVVHVLLGKMLISEGRPDEAIFELREANRLEPSAEAHKTAGYLLRDRGDRSAAITELREAVRLAPDYVEARVDLGVLLVHAGRPGEAIAEYRAALRTRPDFAIAHGNLAGLLAEAADPALVAEALDHARKATASEPNNGSFQLVLALAAYHAGGWDEAIAAARRSTELPGRNAYGYSAFLLALAHARRAEADPAREWFDRAVAWTREHGPNDVELLHCWREAATVLGRPGPDESGLGRLPELPADVFAH
jgi:serine/threonine-protein kinase